MSANELPKITTTRRIALLPSQLRHKCDDLIRDGVGYMGGSYGFYVPSLKTKFVDVNHLSEWPDLEGNVVPMTPSEIARIELSRHFPDIKRVGWNRTSVKLFDKRPPIAYLGQFSGSGWHYDLTGAYHQIYKWLWLDIGYPAGFGCLDLAPLAKRLERHKLARNSIVGIIRARRTSWQKGRESKMLYTKNKYLSPCLWGWIMDVLNEAALTALEYGATYVATDGYIFPDRGVGDEHAFEKFLNIFGFGFRKAYGHIDISGWGSYSTAMKETTPHKSGKPGGQRHFVNVSVQDYEKPIKSILRLQKAKKYRRLLNG